MSRRSAIMAVAGVAILAASWGAIGAKPGSRQAPVHRDVDLPTPPIREPADIQFLPDGSLGVADPAAGSVFLLDPDGSTRWVATAGLLGPMGLCADPRGLWVADAGAGRILLLDAAQGRELVRLDLPDGVEPTDVERTAQGRLWVSAAPQDLLLLLDDEGAILHRVEEVGGAPLAGPRGLASDGGEGVLVAEALRGRILHLDHAGGLVSSMGSWGLGAGEFLKPKHLAVDDAGRIWVTDSHQGAVQVLDGGGAFSFFLSDLDGPARMEHPLGVSTHQGRVAVASATGVRVLQPAAGSAPSGASSPALPPGLENAGGSDELREALCRQCHDGTRRSGAGHWDPLATSHPLVVPADQHVPHSISRTRGGDLSCTSCHPIHRWNPNQGSLAGVVTFGLPPSRPDQGVHGPEFCLECHGSLLETAPPGARRSHPVGLGVAKDAAVRLAAEGAPLHDGALTCRTCHRPHGAVHPHLLTMAPEAGALCGACHGAEARGSRHPVHAVVSGGAHTGPGILPGDVLSCLSCHEPHGAHGGGLLRADLVDRGCGACHATESLHHGSGGHATMACTACHGMHDSPDIPKGTRAPRAGPQECLDCHTTGHQDAPLVALQASHPVGVIPAGGSGADLAPGGVTACTTCHDAHGPGEDLVRAGAPGEPCTTCHQAQATVTGTNHDAAVVPVGDRDRTCTSCHRPHGSTAPFRIEAAPGVNPASGRCLTCHDGGAATDPGPAHHPKGLLLTTMGLPFTYSGTVPYYGPDGAPTGDREVGEITCVTCHDPHRWRHGRDLKPGRVEGNQQDSFLRDPMEVSRFCSVCHGADGLPLLQAFHTVRFREVSE